MMTRSSRFPCFAHAGRRRSRLGWLRAGTTLLALVLVSMLAHADRVKTNDGRDLEGTIVKETSSEITLKTRFGEIKLKRSEIESIERGKTVDQEFDERWKASKKLSDFFELGQWSKEKGSRSKEKKCMRKVLTFDSDHEGAHAALGNVLYKGKWMTVKERDKRAVADLAKQKAGEGLVEHEGKWVTPEEKAGLAAGMVLYNGKWMTLEDSMRAQGFEFWDEKWVPEGVALTLNQAREIADKCGLPQRSSFADSVVVNGPFDYDFLHEIARDLEKGRVWFDEAMGSPAGLEWLGGRAAAFYVFSRDTEPYLKSTDLLAELTFTVPAGWADSVKKTHGFYYADPYCVSAARVWGRPDEHLAGHSYHHWGHLLLGRLDYDGRLLPPWFDEGFASYFEHSIHARNDVFCVGNQSDVSNRTSGSSANFVFKSKEFRRGIWRSELKDALKAGVIRDFDKLAQKEIGNLNLLDIASSMGIVDWMAQLDAPAGEASALRAFHRELRKGAPHAPYRNIEKGKDRQALYDKAFRAACGQSWREADKTWRAWFLKTN